MPAASCESILPVPQAQGRECVKRTTGEIVMPPPTSKRLSKLQEVPLIAALDHRHFKDAEGNDRRLQALSRHERRKLAVESKRLRREYERIIRQFSKTGVGYPVDNLLRELCLEYTHRYATAGLFSQPVNFNYFEPFCNIDLIKESFAPYAEPAPEYYHLFSIIDYLDYTTSDVAVLEPTKLKEMPEGKVFHFTTNGDLTDFTFLTPEGREFVVSGFSMVRHDYLLHWYLVGGELLSKQEWEEKTATDFALDFDTTSPYKHAFLEQCVTQGGKIMGAPVALEGTGTAIRTVIAGETNLESGKHEGRCYMSEREGSFLVLCDNPDVFEPISNQSERNKMIDLMHERVESAAVLWNLAEAMFQLPFYFAFKIPIEKSVLAAAGRSIKATPKGGRGVGGVNYRRVSAIEVVQKVTPMVTAYTPPHYQVETEGFWRRLPKPESVGRGRNGEAIRGRTWIRSSNTWRERPDGPRTIYVKSSVAAAKVAVDEMIEKVNGMENAAPNVPCGPFREEDVGGVLYVVRCTVMRDGVYKVGWTSGTAEDRARKLSAATGVPSSFVVVDYWHHRDPKALETCVHAVLDPYRISEGREFFQADYGTIKRLIETEIDRIDRHSR